MNLSLRTAHRPGKVSLAGAGVVGWSGLQDSAQRVGVHPADSLVDKTLFPDPITTLVQFVFQPRPWVMWGGGVLAAVIAFFLLRWLWPRRQAILTWFRTRSREVKFAMVAGVGVVVVLALGLSYAGYHFVETDKRFCNGCHIF